MRRNLPITVLLIGIFGPYLVHARFEPTAIHNTYPDATPATLASETHQSDSLGQFLIDLTNLQTYVGHLPLLTATHSSRDSSYTKSWTSADWEKHQLQSFSRYQKHLVSWPRSPTAKAVIPTVLTCMIWSSTVSFASAHIPVFKKFVSLSSFATGLSSFSSPIALLLALRTNRALNRLFEARSKFGVVARASASMAGLATLYVTKIDPDKAMLIGRYLALFGWSMKGVFRDEDDTQVCRIILPRWEAEWIEKNAADTPTCIIFRIRQIVASMVNDIPLSALQAMESYICDMEVSLGVCKRLVSSPIPPTYTRHTSRVLCLFLGLLPLALVSAKVPPLAVTIIVALLSYVFVGIDEIGLEVENPFPLLPIYHIAFTIQKGVFNQFAMTSHGTPSP